MPFPRWARLPTWLSRLPVYSHHVLVYIGCNHSNLWLVLDRYITVGEFVPVFHAGTTSLTHDPCSLSVVRYHVRLHSLPLPFSITPNNWMLDVQSHLGHLLDVQSEFSLVALDVQSRWP